MSETPPDLTALTAGIVQAYVARSAIPVRELPELVRTVHDSLVRLDGPSPASSRLPRDAATPAEIRKSVQPDAIVSFINGQAYRSLKRHLTANGLDPASYRQRYGLPADYPMVAPSYSALRSQISKQIGLGQPGGPKPRAQRQAAE